METKFSLALEPKENCVASQGVCFPLAVLRTEPLLLNWYYSNYMMPIASLDGVNCFWIRVADSITYGDPANIYNKVIRLSSTHRHICSQIEDIVSVLKNMIYDEYYIVLFLDFDYLKKLEVSFPKQHFVHELLFYGYDDTRECFNAYGYIGSSYKHVEIPYTEVKEAFTSALKHIDNGWNKHMLMAMHLYYHGEGYQYPYPNKKFIDKLISYVEGTVSEEFKADNLMYIKTSDRQVYASGVKITDIMSEYIKMLRMIDNSSDDECVSQQDAFNMYKVYHTDMYERLVYFAEINGLENQLQWYIEKYFNDIVKESNVVQLLYIKFWMLKDRGLSTSMVLEKMDVHLRMLKENEVSILRGYIDVVKTLNLPNECLKSNKYMLNQSYI